MNQRTFARIGLAALLLSFLAACNTMEGAGRDIEGAGEEIQEEARENQ